MNLSAVVPVYNEAETIEALVQDLGDVLLPAVDRFEAIVVDDASTDETPRILERLAQDRPWLQVHRAPQNAGHGAAVLRGLEAAQGEWIFQIDSDGQFVVAEFPRLWERRAEGDLLLGVRASRHDPLHRLVLTRAVRLTASLLAGRHIRDVNTPFRLMRRTLWEDLQRFIEPGTLAPNILVTLGAAVRGWKTINVPVTHLAREQGTSTLRQLRLLKFSLRGLRQLLVFRRRLMGAPARSKSPAGAGAGS
jgi:dolichol-phosphate mannosyltransferase